MKMNNQQQQQQQLSAEERKRKRLEAWRRKQQQQQSSAPPPPPPPPKPKVSLSLGKVALPKKKNKKTKTTTAAAVVSKKPLVNPLLLYEGDTSDHEADDDAATLQGEDARSQRKKRPIMEKPLLEAEDLVARPPKKRKASRRWDQRGTTTTTSETSKTNNNDINNKDGDGGRDALEQFMDKLEAGALGQITTDVGRGQGQADLSIHVSGSMMMHHMQTTTTTTTTTTVSLKQHNKNPVSGGVITADQLFLQQQQQHSGENGDTTQNNNNSVVYNPKDWLSDATSNDTDDEKEEQARRALIEALKSAPTPTITTQQQESQEEEEEEISRPAQLASEVKTEKSRREERLRQLERDAEEARLSAEAAAAPTLGRLYNDTEDGVMEEAERNLEAAKAAPDALLVLAELNKKKELKAVDHSKIDYIPFQKNLYRVPRALANISNDEVINRRAKLKVRVRGHGAPAPVSSFEQCGLSEKIIKIMEKQDIVKPFPVQAQCIPCIMAGRDVIGIAKTGSGKTLAYLLPLLRHILAQPPLEANESGPIGLILAPARELAFQIHSVCKSFAKQLGLKSTAIYGGAGVAEQIGDLKRGTHIVVATPGRLIDILTMQSGKILSLQRVTYVVMDEADRMYDMGFSPQISAILAAVRPDRQTVLFSATFPKAVESLARKSLKYPLEVVVGSRSVAADNVTQYAELVEENEKFLRLLQLLGEQVEGTKKVIVFVDTQVRADNLFEQLLRNGYPALSLHGGKDQEDRDSTISDFKRKDGPNVLVATGVAGRGLDVPSCCCVINYSAPNHLEAYVHQVGRTGRAGSKGVAYTLVNSTEESKYAPIVVRALSQAGQSENISKPLKDLSDEFKAKVEKGEAKYAGSGFKGKGFTYDSTELSEAQRMARLEKRQALIEAGMLDPDDEDPLLAEQPTKKKTAEAGEDTKKEAEAPMAIPENLTPELLALPGMKEALLRKAGIVPAEQAKEEEAADPSLGRPVKMGDSHWLQEFEINDYPREARWKVTQRETTSRLQDQFRTAVTLKGSYFPSGKTPGEGERRLYLHLEAASERMLQNCVLEIQRLLNEETLRVAKSAAGSSHKYNVL